MGQPAIIHDNIVSAEKVAENFGIPRSRVRTIQQALTKSRQKKKSRSAGSSASVKKHATSGAGGKKRIASKAK
jgi:hypothetical protein